MVRIGNIELGEFPLLLAPMEDVSDPPFRSLCKRHGADMMYTEFISSEGLIRQAAKGLKKLDVYDEERPIGIQLFGGAEEAMEEAAPPPKPMFIAGPPRTTSLAPAANGVLITCSSRMLPRPPASIMGLW